MGSTYRVLTALYINNDTRTRGRSLPPFAILAGSFYVSLSHSLVVSLRFYLSFDLSLCCSSARGFTRVNRSAHAISKAAIHIHAKRFNPQNIRQNWLMSFKDHGQLFCTACFHLPRSRLLVPLGCTFRSLRPLRLKIYFSAITPEEGLPFITCH